MSTIFIIPVHGDSAGPLHSSSQSMQLRSMEQIYDRESANAKLTEIYSDTSDYLLNILNAQKTMHIMLC